MKVLVYLEKAEVRGGIEVFAERHVAQLRAAGHEVEVVGDLSDVECRMPLFDGIFVHKCSDVATLEKFPPEKTTYYVHDHEPICPRTYAYTPFRRNCVRSSGLWPCLFCAPLCRSWKAALARVFAQGRRKRAMARFKRIVVISEFMKGRLVANGLPPERIVVEPPHIIPPPPPPTFHHSPFTFHLSPPRRLALRGSAHQRQGRAAASGCDGHDAFAAHARCGGNREHGGEAQGAGRATGIDGTCTVARVPSESVRVDACSEVRGGTELLAGTVRAGGGRGGGARKEGGCVCGRRSSGSVPWKGDACAAGGC